MMFGTDKSNNLEVKFYDTKYGQKKSKNNSNLYKYLSILSIFITLSIGTFCLFAKPKIIKQNQTEISMLNAKISELNFKLLQSEKKLEAKEKILPKANECVAKKEFKQGYLRLNYIKPNAQILKTESSTQESNEILQQAVEKKQKPKVIINTKENSQNTKNYENLNIDKLLELAEKSYKNTHFEQALKYALMANELNWQNEQSWIIFAKAKFKLGHKADALLALETFNNGKNKKSINLLIRQIKKGEL